MDTPRTEAGSQVSGATPSQTPRTDGDQTDRTHPGRTPRTPRRAANWAELKYGPRLKELAAAARRRVRANSRSGAENASADSLEKQEKFKDEVWKCLTHPNHSTLAWFCVTFIILCIMCSTVFFILETLPALEKDKGWSTLFFVSEFIFVMIFTVEFVLRLWSTPQTKLEFLSEPMNIIDLVAILPFYIELVMVMVMNQGSLGIDLRFLRALRLTRMVKMGRHSSELQLMGEGIQRSQKSFVLLVFMLTLGLVLFSALIWISERGKWDADKQCFARENEVHFSGCSPFESVPLGFWWAVTTMTTVGYGETFPVSPLGRLIGGVAMLCGILCVALPTIVMCVEFSEVLEEQIHGEKKKVKHKKKLRQRNRHELELYIKVLEFDELRRKLDKHLKYIKFVAMAEAEANDEELHIDPAFTSFQVQCTKSLGQVKQVVLQNTDGYIT